MGFPVTSQPKWAVLADSVMGTSHRQRNVVCQDALRWQVFGPTAEHLVVVVADGAGSASHSDRGATVVCDEFVRRIVSRSTDAPFREEEMVAMFDDIRNTVVAEADQAGIRPREFACTVLVAVVGPWSSVFAQLGDGVIVYGAHRDYRVAFWPEPAEYANATDFLTDEHFRKAIQIVTTDEPVNELAVLTDGLQRLALDFATRSPFADFFRPFFERVRTEADLESLAGPFREFLDSSRVNARTDDDKTLVLATRRP